MAKTSFKAGGLIPMDNALMRAERIATPDDFDVPLTHEARFECLYPDNQGSTSECAGRAMAGYIEVHNWRQTHRAIQEDGSALYAEAKKIDGFPDEDGTTASAIVQAAKNLGRLDESLTMRRIRTQLDVQFALHTHRVIMAGFMISQNWNYAKKDGFIGTKWDDRIGGHMVLLNSYNLDPEEGPLYYGWQNSWGFDWGWHGNGRMTPKQFSSELIYAVVLE